MAESSSAGPRAARVGFFTAVSGSKSQSGRAGVVALVVLVLLAGGAYAAWTMAHQSPNLSANSSPADAQSGSQKAQAFSNAQAQALRTGRPVPVSETFSDAELSALANQAAANRNLPISQISLHTTNQGTVQGQAQASVAGQTVPVTLEGVPVVTGDHVALNVTSTHMGSIPLPGAISDQVTQQIKQPLELGASFNNWQNVRVSVAQGQLTVSGTAEPS